MDRVEEVLVVDHPNDQANDGNHLGEEFTKLVNFFRQGRCLLFLRCLVNGRLDMANLSAHSGSHDDAQTGTVGDSCRGEKHVCLGLDLAVLGRSSKCIGFLGHRLRLARQLRLLNAESRRVQAHKTQVSGDLVTHTDLDKVAGNQENGIDFNSLAVTNDDGVVGLKFLQCVQGLLSTGFLPDTYSGVSHQDQQNDKRLHVGQETHVVVRVIEVCQQERNNRRT